jgi:hypothetical protein
MAIVVENGITVGPGISIGAGGAAPGPSGVDNVLGYAEMNPPIVPGNQLEDPTATINGSVGFTINDDTKTGVAVTALTVSNDNWITTNYTTVPGTYTCSWGPGSTVASSSIIVTQASTSLVFFIQGQSGPATYNYPFTLGL